MKSDWKGGKVKMNRYSPADRVTVELDTYVNRKCRSSQINPTLSVSMIEETRTLS